MADRCPIFCLPLLFSFVFRQLFRCISNDTQSLTHFPASADMSNIRTS